MSRVVKKRKKVLKVFQVGGIISDGIKDHGNDAYFEKKADASLKVLEKYGFPKSFTSNK